MSPLKTFAIVCCLILAACSAKPPSRVQYLLRASEAPARAVRVEAPVHVGLGNVSVAPYLRQVGIVVATEDGQVHAANNHLWAEPLDAGLRSYLRTEISEKLGYEISAGGADKLDWRYTIDVYVDRLHGTMAGEAVLDASYQITSHDGDGNVSDYRFSHTTGLPREGYAGLVAAERTLVDQLAAAIVDSLGELRAR